MPVEVVGGVEAKLSLDISQFTSAISEATKEAEKLSSGLANIKPNNTLDSNITKTEELITNLQQTIEGLASTVKSSFTNIGSTLTNHFNKPLIEAKKRAEEMTASITQFRTNYMKTFEQGKISLEQLVNGFKELNISEEESIKLTKELEASITNAFANSTMSAMEYVNALKEIGVATSKNSYRDALQQYRGMPTSASFVKQIQQYATSLKEGGVTAQEFATKLKELGITSKELATISREVGGAYIESFKRGEMGVSELLMKFKELTFTESELYVYNQRLAVSFVQAFRNGAISLEELVTSFKQLDMSEKQTEELTKILEKTLTMAFKNEKLEAENYIRSLQEVGVATEKVALKTKQLGSTGSLLGAGSVSNSKNKGTGAGFGGVIDRTANLVKMMAMLEVFMGTWEATESYMESSSAIRGFYDLLSKRDDKTRWNAKNLSEYNQRLSELQGTYSKLNVRETGAEVMKIGQMYGLSAKEIYSNTKDLKDGQKDFVETALIFTDAMANEGRSSRDASLALKDLIDQGEGWSRRTQEIGITEDVLKAQKDKNENPQAVLAQLRSDINSDDVQAVGRAYASKYSGVPGYEYVVKEAQEYADNWKYYEQNKADKIAYLNELAKQYS